MKFCSLTSASPALHAAVGVSFSVWLFVCLSPQSFAADTPELRTPKPTPAPHINGPSIFGVRPDAPFLYRILASGARPIEFNTDSLPSGLHLDSKSGEISGALKKPGEYTSTLRAKNAAGRAEKKFRIIVGETIALTPPMGWNSWNCWGSKVDAEKVLKSARGMVASGLINHGWTYINIDDAWQGKRGGPFNGIQGNEKFPDMKGPLRHDPQHGLEGRHLFHALDDFLRQLHRRQRRESRRHMVANPRSPSRATSTRRFCPGPSANIPSPPTTPSNGPPGASII